MTSVDSSPGSLKGEAGTGAPLWSIMIFSKGGWLVVTDVLVDVFHLVFVTTFIFW